MSNPFPVLNPTIEDQLLRAARERRKGRKNFAAYVNAINSISAHAGEVHVRQNSGPGIPPATTDDSSAHRCAGSPQNT